MPTKAAPAETLPAPTLDAASKPPRMLTDVFREQLRLRRYARRWLRLIQRVPLLEAAAVQSLVQETEELIRIFSTSIRTASRGVSGVQR